jgi:hypothetical protein
MTILFRNLIRFSLIAIALPALITSAQAQAKATVYKIADAGIQIDLPAGWEASKDANGTHVISKKDGDGYVLFSMSVLPRDPAVNVDSLFAAFSDGIFQEAKKDWKGFKQGELLKDTQNGMAVRAQKIDGSMESAGGELEGLVILIDSPKPLGIFGQRTKKHSELLEKESTEILGSIKKISSNPGVGHED